MVRSAGGAALKGLKRQKSDKLPQRFNNRDQFLDILEGHDRFRGLTARRSLVSACGDNSGVSVSRDRQEGLDEPRRLEAARRLRSRASRGTA
jgi:hypothetical protein